MVSFSKRPSGKYQRIMASVQKKGFNVTAVYFTQIVVPLHVRGGLA